MSFKIKLQEDIKDAMRAKERRKLTTLRSIMAEIQSLEIEKQGVLEEEEYLALLNRLVKQRRESIEQFTQAERTDLVAKEEEELAYIEPYLPEQLTEEELVEIVTSVIQEVGATSMKEMGRVMGRLSKELAGRADLGDANRIVRSQLG